MRIDHLQYLLEIDKHHSISAAAQTLYLGQTTLSSIIKGIEAELGIKIFRRTHSGVQTTPEGEEALVLIRQISSFYEQIRQIQAQETADKTVSLVLAPAINSALALPLNRLFLEKDPMGNLEFIAVEGSEVGATIIKNDHNLGITYFTETDLESFQMIASKYGIHVHSLLEDRIYLVMRSDHPLAGRTNISQQDIKELDFAMLDHFSSNEKYVHIGSRRTTYPNVTLLLEAVKGQNMVTLLNGYTALMCGGTDPLLKMIPLDIQPSLIYLCLIHRNDRDLHSQEKLLIQCVRQYFRKI